MIVENIAIPLDNALLPDKSEASYNALLEKIKINGHFSAPSSLTLDFEPVISKIKAMYKIETSN